MQLGRARLSCATVIVLLALAGQAEDAWQTNYSGFGKLLVTEFVAAPFPHPARAAGRTRDGKVYTATDHYSDRTVALFIPKDFRPGTEVDFVVHFHGWNNTVAGTLAQFNLVQQFCDSGKNAILIVPQGPHDAPDSFGGKLEDTNGFKVFMAEALEKLHAGNAPGQTTFSIGNLILSGHSGGYHVMAAIVDHGGLPIKEAWLFDALYGNTENFVAWQQREKGRMMNIYTDQGGTKPETERLMAAYQTRGVSFVSLEETNAVPQDLQRGRIVFLHTELAHNEVIFRRGEFSQFLKTSCLQTR